MVAGPCTVEYIDRGQPPAVDTLADVCLDGVDLFSPQHTFVGRYRPLVATMEFSVLGPLRVRRGAVQERTGQPRQCAVLAALLLRAGSPVSVATLVDDVWGDQAPPSAVGSVRTYVYRLRRMLSAEGEDRIRLSDGGYSLQIEPEAVDVVRFKRLVSAARAARATGNHAGASTLFREGLALWHGSALAGVPGPYAEMQRSLMEELRLSCIEEQLSCDVELGRYAVSAVELSALVSEHPLRERLCELYMTALYGAGRQSEALTAYHAISHTVRQKLGVDPSPALRKLHQLMLTDELNLPAPATGPGEPVPALQPVFAAPAQLPADLPYFVGREEELARLLPAAHAPAGADTSTYVIGGMAGVGKTALAIRLAHRMASCFPDGQLFADLRGFSRCGDQRDPAEILGEFLEALGVPPDQVPAKVQARAKLFRGLLSGRRVLLVLDDVHSSSDVHDLLPGSARCLTIVTSRNQLPHLLMTHQALPLRLDPLGTAESWDLLARHVGAERLHADPGATEDVVRLCGRLPLALSIIGVRAAYRPSLSMRRIAAEMTANGGPLDAFVDIGEPGLDVRSALRSSYEALDPASARLLCRLSVLQGCEFTDAEAAAVVGGHPAQVKKLLFRLAQSHLLTETSPGRYHWNTFVRAFAKEVLHADGGGARTDPAEDVTPPRPGTAPEL